MRNYSTRTYIGLAVVLMVCSMGCANALDKYHLQSYAYWSQAEQLRKKGRYFEAAQSYEKSIQAEQASSKPRLVHLAKDFVWAGYCYSTIGRYNKALEYYQQALELDRMLDRKTQIAIDLNNIGLVYRAWGQYDKALASFEQALELARKLGEESSIALYLNNIGGIYEAWGQYDKALEYYEQALELARKLGEESRIALYLNNIGGIHNVWGQYDKALASFEQALELARKLGEEPRIALYLNNIGEMYRLWGQYDNALVSFEQALELARKLGEEPRIITYLGNIGLVYYAWGQYDNALVSFEQALELARKLGAEPAMTIYLNNIGEVYRAWGQYDNALTSFTQALELNRKLGNDTEIATNLSNIGLVYETQRQYDKALVSFEQALELARKLGDQARIATYLNNIGLVYGTWKQYDNALNYYEQALEISRKLGRDADIAMNLNNIAWVHNAQEQYAKALDYYAQALDLARKLERDADIAIHLNNIGAVYYNQENYAEAITHFAESVEIKERLRKTATEDVRRDYLATQIYTYQFLISCYVRTGDFAKAFEIIELGRAKLLTERLAGSDEVKIPSLEYIQNTLPQDTAALVYANTDRPDLNMVHMIITRENVTTQERSISNFVQNVTESDHLDAPAALTDSRGLNMGQNEDKKTVVATEEKEPLDFAAIIGDYRVQLLSPSFTRGLALERQEEPVREDTSKEYLSKNLYSLLLGDGQKQLRGKTRLIIVPDGMLNFLPFETLIDEQGNYLVEKYHVTYAQSLGVLEQIKHWQYSQDRKPLLAFGGAIYDAPVYQVETITNEKQLAYLQRQVDTALSQGSPVGALYAQLRGGEWSNLPGTLQEVKAIQQVVPGAELMTGEDASEAVVKALSATNELANYKVLHFATHGDADPRIPELSALVLSLLPGSAGVSPASEKRAGETPALPGTSEMLAVQGEEDGYLRAGEIVDLKLNADFVNLSACETGLGKLYSGEGVVGLTQAFLIAGANGLSVSLWQVADESTAAFMVALYTLVEKQDISYAEAIAEVKRRFINGDFGEQWQAPYYWAPFVYYGK